MRKEMERFPIVGVYKDETKEEWSNFVKYIGSIYQDIEGQRRLIIDKTKEVI